MITCSTICSTKRCRTSFQEKTMKTSASTPTAAAPVPQKKILGAMADTPKPSNPVPPRVSNKKTSEYRSVQVGVRGGLGHSPEGGDVCCCFCFCCCYCRDLSGTMSMSTSSGDETVQEPSMAKNSSPSLNSRQPGGARKMRQNRRNPSPTAR